jgi:uncharacterized protein (TIGR00106 family)
MKVIAEFCLVPIGVGTSLSRYIAECERILEEAGLNPQLHAYGTNVEGEWDNVVGALKRCHETLHEMGVPRLFTTVKLGTRIDRTATMEQKVNSVRESRRNGD